MNLISADSPQRFGFATGAIELILLALDSRYSG